tara:strand:- start:334 stop:936 length:603 start_codon:yes stop_codon:yes gene_type:complete
VIDLVKYSNKNILTNFIIKKILRIDTSYLSKPFFFKKNIELNIDDNFFYDYLNKNSITKWSGENSPEHYQSNHDLQKLDYFKRPIKLLENYLNTEIKQNIFKDNQFGKFKIKSLWFTIQKINQGHSKHNHPKSALSGVYYHQIDKNSGGSIEVFLEKEKIEYSPKKNDLIIFNSDTYHSVKPYNGINDRIAIAWDAIYTL